MRVGIRVRLFSLSPMCRQADKRVPKSWGHLLSTTLTFSGMKVALFLEEAGLPYEPIPVDTRKGDQHKPEYLAINPNAKVPAIVDGDVTVFDSNAILLYLAQNDPKRTYGSALLP
jgi:glutathione S-transferase